MIFSSHSLSRVCCPPQTLEWGEILADHSSFCRPGARVYYLRNIFHAWTDATCKEILLNAKAGLTEESIIMIDEIVLPNRGATVQGAQQDMEVMVSVGMYGLFRAAVHMTLQSLSHAQRPSP